jgi:imidazolonepropionase-like amidohydrolase
MGDRFSADIELKGSIARGVVIGPRLWVAGDVGWSRREAGADTFRKMARERLRQGADHIKLFNTGGIAWPAKTIGHLICTAEEIRAAVEEAHHWGKPAVVHAMGDEGMIMAAEAGADSIEHGFVMGEASIDSMKKHGTVFSPQLAVTAAWNEEFMRAQGVFPEWLIINAVEAREVHHAMVAKAHKAGIPMISGVDNLPKIPLQAGIEVFEGRPAIVAEIHFMQKIGMTALEALQTATINAARVCGAEESLGTLEVGKLADVIAVRGNPLDDLERLQNVRLVMKDGEVIRADHALPRGVGLARPGDVSANRQIVMDAE